MILDELRRRLESYLALREALGYSLRTCRPLLNSFVEHIEASNNDGPITTQVTLEWARASSCGAGGQARRLSAARGFLTYLSAWCGDVAIPARSLSPHYRRPIPYIYSIAEIQQLIAAARSLGPRGSLRPHTFATVIGLLASCGLRVGEVSCLRLDDADLDIDPPRLHIWQAKFGKSRSVPVHPSTAQALRGYIATRRELGYDRLSDALFVSEQGGPLSYAAIWRTFKKLVQLAKIHRSPKIGRAPTAGGLRHTFATERLLAWCRDGVDLRAWLPHLAVYLGHVRPEHTYWYLTATPALLRVAAERFESHFDQGEQP